MRGIYQVRPIFMFARNTNFVFEGEGRTRKRRPDEDPEDAAMRDAFYRPIERFIEEKGPFADLQAKKFRAMACFGSSAAEPFDALGVLHVGIVTSAQSLIDAWPPKDDATAEQCEQWLSIVNSTWSSESDDKIQQELDRIVQCFEELFGKWLLRKGAY